MNEEAAIMDNMQSYRDLPGKDVLISEVDKMRKDGFRLVQIHAIRKGSSVILYSFEKDYRMVNLRLRVEDGEEIESVSSIYSYAYLYENEMKDLFGLNIKNINIDFKGNLYQTSVKTPFAGEAETK